MFILFLMLFECCFKIFLMNIFIAFGGSFQDEREKRSILQDLIVILLTRDISVKSGMFSAFRFFQVFVFVTFRLLDCR